MFAKIPELVKKLFPERVWDISTEKKEIFLTFDDGPIPGITPWVLKQLKKYNAKATFFCIGENIEKQPEIFQKILSEGHSIGNHTQNHLNGWRASPEKYLQNVLKAEAIIEENGKERRAKREKNRKKKCPEEQIRAKFENQDSEIKNSTFKTTHLFRPPYGRITGKQVKLLQERNYKIIMWNVLSMDYRKNISAEKCYNNIVKNGISGSIFVFHDSLKAEKNLRAILPKVLEHFQKRGFSFEKLEF